MAEDRDESYRDSSEPPPMTGRSGGSLIIFALIAMALILAIGFFYITKDRGEEPANTVIDAAESADSAAHVVGDAAKNAADTLRNRN